MKSKTWLHAHTVVFTMYSVWYIAHLNVSCEICKWYILHHTQNCITKHAMKSCVIHYTNKCITHISHFDHWVTTGGLIVSLSSSNILNHFWYIQSDNISHGSMIWIYATIHPTLTGYGDCITHWKYVTPICNTRVYIV